MEIKVLLGITAAAATAIALYLQIRATSALRKQKSESKAGVELAIKLNQDVKNLLSDLRETHGDSKELQDRVKKMDDLIDALPPEHKRRQF